MTAPRMGSDLLYLTAALLWRSLVIDSLSFLRGGCNMGRDRQSPAPVTSVDELETIASARGHHALVPGLNAGSPQLGAK